MRADLDIVGLVEELFDQVKAVISGKMDRPEAILVDQAHTLDAIFNNLARRAGANIDEHPMGADACLRLALRAQSQCRATLETLATVKNPPSIAFVRQANVAHGPQQVNNALQPAETSRARESENQPNKLLEQQRNDGLDTRATQATVGADSAVEAVGAVHRTKDGHG